MAHSKVKVKNNGIRASPCFKPFLIGNMSDKLLPTRILLYVPVRRTFISLASFMWIHIYISDLGFYTALTLVMAVEQVSKTLVFDPSVT